MTTTLQNPKNVPQNLSPEEFLSWLEKDLLNKYEYNQDQIRMMGAAK